MHGPWHTAGGDRRGFTLLELLVGMAILGLVLTSVYGAVARTLTATRYAEARAELYSSGREVVMRLADEIEGALPPSSGRDIYFLGLPPEDGTPAGMLQFTTVVRRRQNAGQLRGGRAVVTYTLDEMPELKGRYALGRIEELIRAPMAPAQTESRFDSVEQQAPGETEPLDGGEDGAAEPVPEIFAGHLVDQVLGMKFLFADPVDGEWSDSWDTAEVTDDGELRGLPAAVWLMLVLEADDGTAHEFGTVVDLPLAAPPATPGP